MPVIAQTHRPVVMLTSSYPRFPGDGIGSFLEPIAHGVAKRGREVHVVAPWHPRIRRPPHEGSVHFHFFRYAPTEGLHVFGYAAALKADVALRRTAYIAAPAAIISGCRRLRRVARAEGAEVVHAHWVVPGGIMATLSRTALPLVISLHGSDVFLAEKNRFVRTAVKVAFRRAGAVTACSEDLRQRAIGLGACEDTVTVVPYGVDTDRFKPSRRERERIRQAHGAATDDPILVAAGRLVRKKGFDYLIDAMTSIATRWPRATLVIVGQGDLEEELRQRTIAHDVSERVVFTGAIPQEEVAKWLSAADIVVVPSIRDDAGNVDGLPNVLLEALSSGTPVITTPAGGIESVAVDGRTARIVPERNADAIATAVDDILRHPALAAQLGQVARETMCRAHSWELTAERFEDAYLRAIHVVRYGRSEA